MSLTTALVLVVVLAHVIAYWPEKKRINDHHRPDHRP